MTAIEEFNEAFGHTVADRPHGILQAAMIELANERGRTDIAKRLRDQFDSVRVSEIRTREFLKHERAA